MYRKNSAAVRLGKVKSEAKAAAARRNGQIGGRPRRGKTTIHERVDLLERDVRALLKRDVVSEISEIESVLAEMTGAPARMSLLDFVKRCIEVMGGGFLLGGGFAKSILQGQASATEDFDVFVHTQDIVKIDKKLRAAGFEFKQVIDYSKPKRLLHKYGLNGRELDVIEYLDREFAEALFEFAKPTQILGRKILLPSIEGFILTKLASGRPKDISHISELAEKPVDWAFVKTWAADLGIMSRLSAVPGLKDKL
jgi:hypothetical protein